MSEHNQGSGPLEPVKRYLVKGIASGIGLASEGITSYKERKKLRKAGLVPADSALSMPSSPSSEEALHISRLATPPLSDHEKDLDSDTKDEKLWTLDEAQDEASPPPYTERATTPDGGKALDVMEDFLQQHPAPAYDASATRVQLPQPVILPQKRPKTRSRGFVRAYAPSLAPCGISQDMFLDFITAFDTSTQASPWLDAINLASIGLTFIPHFPMLVGIAIQVSIMAAKDVQGRTRTNSFLDKANAQIFAPRGLYCLIMTYSPTQEQQEQEQEQEQYRDQDQGGNPLDGMPVSSAIASRLNSSGLQKFQNRFREASGRACEAQIPESAALIFPGLTDAAAATPLHMQDLEESKNAREKMKRAQRYITDYYDKRAQAKFVGKNAGSSLVKGPAPQFTCRYADPNHPASSGSFRSLITGGYITPPDMGRMEQQQRQRQRQQQMDGRTGPQDEWEEQSVQNPPAPYGAYRGRGYSQRVSPGGQRRNQDVARRGPLGLPSPGTLVKKAFQNNILYMMVVNMPSDEDLALAREHVQQSRSRGINMSDFVTHLRGH